MGAYYRSYLVAATAARLADSMWVGVVLFVLARTHDPALAGGTLAAATLPTVISAPLLGAWLDTTAHRRAALAVNQVLLAGCVLTLLTLVGHVPAPAVLGCAALAGITQPLVTGGFSSLVPALVPPARVPRACALESVTYDVAEVAGPALAGGLAALSPGGALVGQAAIALAGLPLLARLPAGSAAGRAGPPPPATGVARTPALLGSRPLRSATAASGPAAAARGALPVGVPPAGRPPPRARAGG